jgi:5'-nucleotidase / UDP-sugar diphosphatase
LGNLFADLIAQRAGADVVFVGSGSIRGERLGPVVTMGDLYRIFPYDDSLSKYTITGAQLKRIFGYVMRPENRTGEGECYEVNCGVCAVYDDGLRALESLSVQGQPAADDGHYTVVLQGYHFKSSEGNLGISQSDLMALTGSQVVSTSARDVIEEALRSRQNLNSSVEGRLVYR